MSQAPPTRDLQPEPSAEGRLDSWKEIAAYLSRGTRTVQRWEREHRLPVHRLRLTRGRGASVHAYKAELDTWWAAHRADLEQESPEAAPAPDGRLLPRRAVWIAVLASITVIASLAGWWLSGSGRASRAPLRVVPLTSYAGYEDYASFSPDGEHVAFSWTGAKQDNLDIYVKTIGREPPLRLTRDPLPDSYPTWSPDGRWIAFLRSKRPEADAVLLVPAQGGPERQVAEVCNLQGDLRDPLLAWTPDGRWLIVPDKSAPAEPYALILLSPDSGEKRRLTAPSSRSLGDSSPAVSPDGKILAFSRCATIEVCDIHLLDLFPDSTAKGQPRRLSREQAAIASIMWLPGGRELLYVLGHGDLPTLQRIEVVGSARAKPVSSVTNIGYQVRISPRGDRLAYTLGSDDRNVYRVPLSERGEVTGPPEKLASSTRIEQSPSISPDGKRIAVMSYRTGHPEIWVSNLDGSGAVQVTSFGGPLTAIPRWSPDGRYIAFDSRAGGDAEIYVVSPAGGRATRLTSEPSNDCVPSWSRDGRWIYFASDRSGEFQIWRMPASGGQAIQVTRRGGYGAFEAPDGRLLYYAKTYGYGKTSLWRVPVQGGDEVQVIADVWSRHSFYVVDEGIYFIHSLDPEVGYPICFYRFSTGRIERVGVINRSLAIGLCAWPLSRPQWLLYAVHEESPSDLMLVENFR